MPLGRGLTLSPPAGRPHDVLRHRCTFLASFSASLSRCCSPRCSLTRLDPVSQAVLGISLKPEDTLEHPNAPLLSAGTRRQNACRALFDKAHGDNYDAGTADTPSAENLATLLALLQLSLCASTSLPLLDFVLLEFLTLSRPRPAVAELCVLSSPRSLSAALVADLLPEVPPPPPALPIRSHPIKSRPLLRSALSHYRDLQDEADTEEERASVRSTFGFAIYVRSPPSSAFST